MPSKAELDTALSRYPQSLALRAAASKSSKDLVELDEWYRVDLRETTASRRKENEGGEAYLTQEELGKLMRWKLARGKFRPRLEALALSNPDSLVRSTSSSASVASPSSALSSLSSLKGCGPATASAILTLWHPESEPFMSDEAMEHCEAYGEGEEGKGKREYTVKAWKAFGEKMRERKEKEGWESMEQLEMALWSWGVERKYGGKEGTAEAEKATKATKKRARRTEEILPKLATKKRKST
ncbi:hypothetical protein JCM6882_008177 [Rhodosporidiobolus microsporus]